MVRALFSSIIAREIAFSNGMFVLISFIAGMKCMLKCVCKIWTYCVRRVLQSPAMSVRDFFASSVGAVLDMPE